MGNGFVRKSSHCWSPVFPFAYKRLKTLIFLLQASHNTGFNSTIQTTHHLPQVVSKFRIVFSASRTVFWCGPKNVLKNTLFINITRSNLNRSAKQKYFEWYKEIKISQKQTLSWHHFGTVGFWWEENWNSWVFCGWALIAFCLRLQAFSYGHCHGRDCIST